MNYSHDEVDALKCMCQGQVGDIKEDAFADFVKNELVAKGVILVHDEKLKLTQVGVNECKALMNLRVPMGGGNQQVFVNGQRVR